MEKTYWKTLKEVSRRGKHRYFLCKCVCGKVKEVAYDSFKRGISRSCGCVFPPRNTKHNLSKTRFYRIWAGMKKRSENPGRYSHVTICKEWSDFINFQKDMYSSYEIHVRQHGESKTSIDRIDGEKGYFLKNCRWSTPIGQANNTKKNVFLTYKNQTLTIAQWSKCIHIKYGTLHSRYKKGWDIKSIFETPVTPNGK